MDNLRGPVPDLAQPVTPRLEISLWRRIADHGATLFAVSTVIIVLTPLVAIFAYLVIKGIGSVNWAFLTQTPKPPGEIGGGMANAIAGSVLILSIGSLLGVPLGIGAGIYLAEFGRNRFGDLVRFVSDVLNGVPSIVMGIVAYALVVLRQKHFSALAGGVALAIMMVPTITRTTEEMLLLVPNDCAKPRSDWACPRWRTTMSITLRTASSGVITGVMLAFARVAGETAPLLFTAFGNQFWNLESEPAHGGATVADIHVCHFALRRMAQTGMGGGAGTDHTDCLGGSGRTLCGSARNSRRSRLAMGVGIQVENLNAWYGKTQALHEINLKVEANHATALIGPSGCGKSTFIRCLNRMHETSPEARVEGKVKIGEYDAYEGTSATKLRRRIGMVFQKPNPFPTMSIYDNVAAGLKLNGYRDRKHLDDVVEKSLMSSALWDEVKDNIHKKSGASLSGGQQQRLCIARALAVEPEVLLMDEPVFRAGSHLDRQN